MEDKRRVKWGGRGQSCVSRHVFLPPTLQLKQDHKSDRRHCHCAVSWLLPTKGLSLMYYSIEKGPKSVINSNFRMFANSQSLLVNTYQQWKTVIHNVRDKLHQGKEGEERKGDEVSFLTWTIILSPAATFPQVWFTFISFREPCC